MAVDLTIKSFPKINLALDILKKTRSGYHEIQTVFHQLQKPFDELVLTRTDDNDIKVECDNPKMPLDKTNTVLKAALLLKRYVGGRCGAKIFIKKRIPLMSGLGGGASNAVAALKGLAKIWGGKCCEDMRHQTSKCLLRRIADQIGMDCAFFFFGGVAFGEHFGEKITPLPVLPSAINIRVIDTGIEVSSYSAYQMVEFKKCAQNKEKTKQLIASLRRHDADGILENLHNDFEQFVFKKHPRLAVVKQRLSPLKKILLCGSGGCLAKISFHS